MNFLSKTNFTNKTVLIYANLDTDVYKGNLIDDTVLHNLEKTIQFLIQKNNKIVIISHYLHANGNEDYDLSLMPVRFAFSKIIGKTAKFVSPLNPVNSIKYLNPGDILIIENLGFFQDSFSSNTVILEEFYKNILNNVNVYVDESFGNNKYPHVLEFLKSKFDEYYIGCNYEYEINFAKQVTNSKKPLVAILGGRTNMHKISFIKECHKRFDKILLGGLFAIDIIKLLQNNYTGKSDEGFNYEEYLEEILKILKSNNSNIYLPTDHIVVDKHDNVLELKTQNFDKGLIPKDVGPATLIFFREIIESAETILWNGPVGQFEDERFNIGTEAIGEYIALSASRKAVKIATGKKTLEAISKLKIKHKRFTHLSSGEGYFLDYIR